MAYPRSKSFRYFGNARGPAPRSVGAPRDAELNAIMDDVSAGRVSPEEGAAKVAELMASRAKQSQTAS